jgi:hypothetical protein
MRKSTKVRRYDIDWLRIIATFQIFLLHVTGIFIYGWHPIKNNHLSLEMTVLALFLALWPMPLFFILSGAGTYYALGFRKPKQFIHERIKRILIPFIFGIFVIIPPQVYIERLSNNQFSGSFLQFYPHYFEGIHSSGGNFSLFGHHLWYLLILFIYSLITLPLLIRLRKETGKKTISKLAAFFEKPGAFLLPAIPFIILEIILNPIGLGTEQFGIFGGWNFFAYILFFIYGYLIFSDLRFQHIMQRYWKISLILGVITSALVTFFLYFWLQVETFGRAFINLFVNIPVHGASGEGLLIFFLIIGALYWILRCFSAWFWIVAILGLSSIYLNRNHKFLQYANEAVLPLYILHLTVIVVIGFYIVQWNLGIAEKFIMISIISLAVMLAIYGLIIRPFNVMRFLFGMKSKKT